VARAPRALPTVAPCGGRSERAKIGADERANAKRPEVKPRQNKMLDFRAAR